MADEEDIVAVARIMVGCPWDSDHYAQVASEHCQKLADEIERLREAIRRLAAQDATLSVHGGSVTVTLDATLTDAEREAIEAAIVGRLELGDFATLRTLLERIK